MADKEQENMSIPDDGEDGFAREEDSMDKEERFSVSDYHFGSLSDILKSPFGGEFSKPFARDIFLRHVPIVGGHHVPDIEKLWKKLKKDDTVYLIREPQNQADEYAILVLNEDRAKLGYVPRAENKIQARLMDAGKTMHAEISMIQDLEDYYDPVWIAIYMED